MSVRRKHMGRSFTALALALSWTGMFGPLRAQPAASEAKAHEARAHFVGNLIKSTDWPKEAFEDENAPFILGILGKDSFSDRLDIVKVYGTKGRKLEVKHFSKVQQVESCHLLFISSSEENRLADILPIVGKSGVLTVAELSTPDLQKANDRNGMVYFTMEEAKPGILNPRFKINPDVVEKANLRMPSQLYAIAKKYWK